MFKSGIIFKIHLYITYFSLLKKTVLIFVELLPKNVTVFIPDIKVSSLFQI